MTSARRNLENLLIRAPQEVVVALARLLLFLLFLVPTLILRLIELAIPLARTRNLLGERSGRTFPPLPEALMRRPDPSIYCQWGLKAQGLPVTWNNPDIWVTRADTPDAMEPDSYHLQPDAHYRVNVRVHNASTDPALGVRVRLCYHPWSFNAPESYPVEIDDAGQEVVRSTDVPPMGSSIVRFSWHTPRLEPGSLSGRFGLRAEVSHPLDTNPTNNLGEANTLVYQGPSPFVSPGQQAVIEVPLCNPGRSTRRYRLAWDAYEIKRDDTVELRLETDRGVPRLSPAARLAGSLPRLAGRVERARREGEGRWLPGAFSLASGARTLLRSRYVGLEALREAILSRDYQLPRGFMVQAQGIDEEVGLSLKPGDQRRVQLRVRIPERAAPGSRLTLNVHALDDRGLLAGGVTLYFLVREA